MILSLNVSLPLILGSFCFIHLKSDAYCSLHWVHLTMGALCLLHWIYFKTLILVHLAHGECAELCRLFEKASHKEVEVVFFLLKLIIATPALVLVEANG